ncbi:methyl-accepting chemotaxis protein [Paenibacillus septentrionalis]|uniref:Methyl-accepting chemotaxis protein n=1 Tax=Paenibacillus septentrionalis TaxID=429342 RepID=A0ABW1V590_9BACL
MNSNKNRLMSWYACFSVILSIIIHVMQRKFQILEELSHHHGGMHSLALNVEVQYGIALNALLMLPIVLWLAAFILLKKNHDHPMIPLLTTLSLTLSSVSLIAGGGGMVELHFSIFMVVAAIAYYEQIKLISISTIIFAIQHLIGLIWFPRLVFGADSYSFGMFLLHALFLVLTSLATIRQIYQKQRVLAVVEEEKREKDQQLQLLMQNVERMSRELDQSSQAMREQSEYHVRTSREMVQSFQEVTKGFEQQHQSIASVHLALDAVKRLVNANSAAFQQLHRHMLETTATAEHSEKALDKLNDRIERVSDTMAEASMTTEALYTATSQIHQAMNLITQVSNQTKLLAINAAIEASHAGEHGRGFAVVAKEIQRLADESKAASEGIGGILSQVVVETDRTLTHMKQGEQESQQSVALAKDAADQYEQMKLASELMQSIIKQLYESVQELQHKSDLMADEMMSMSALTEEGVASVEQLLASTEQQQVATASIHDEIEQVSQLAMKLTKQLKT